MLLKFNSSEQVTANAAARNHKSRSYWISNFPERNWYNIINVTDTRSSVTNLLLLPKGNEKRCRNSAETSRAMSVRVADLSDLYVGKAGVAADVSARSRRSTLYWLTLLATVPIVQSFDVRSRRTQSIARRIITSRFRHGGLGIRARLVGSCHWQ